jgi:hypothetical protein
MNILPSAPPTYNAYSPGSSATALSAVGNTIDRKSVPSARLQICSHQKKNYESKTNPPYNNIYLSALETTTNLMELPKTTKGLYSVAEQLTLKQEWRRI